VKPRVFKGRAGGSRTTKKRTSRGGVPGQPGGGFVSNSQGAPRSGEGKIVRSVAGNSRDQNGGLGIKLQGLGARKKERGSFFSSRVFGSFPWRANFFVGLTSFQLFSTEFKGVPRDFLGLFVFRFLTFEGVNGRAGSVSCIGILSFCSLDGQTPPFLSRLGLDPGRPNAPRPLSRPRLVRSQGKGSS